MRCTPNPNRQNQNTTDEIVSRTLDELAAALEAGNSAALTAYLQVMGRFHKYSWTNSLLIAAQRPAAAQVAVFVPGFASAGMFAKAKKESSFLHRSSRNTEQRTVRSHRTKPVRCPLAWSASEVPMFSTLRRPMGRLYRSLLPSSATLPNTSNV